MTKTIVIGDSQKQVAKKAICFRYVLNHCDPTQPNLLKTSNIPSSYKFVELICLNYIAGTDLMFAYDDEDKRDKGVLFIGSWNDGVV